MAVECTVVDVDDTTSYPVITIPDSWQVLINEGMIYQQLVNGAVVENTEIKLKIMEMIGEDPSC